MKTLFKLILILGLFTSCHYSTKDIYITESFELRQLVNDQHKTTSSNGSYFLIAASWNSSTKKENKVKMFAKVNDYYKYIECDIENIRIKIDDSIKKPYVQIQYKDYGKKSNEDATEYIDWGKTLFLTCPEKFLPEKLLNIQLKQY